MNQPDFTREPDWADLVAAGRVAPPRPEALAATRAAVAQAARDCGGSTLLTGDFNTPVGSGIFRKSWSPAFADAFTTAGWGFGYTYYVRRTCTRIDHVLFGREWTCRNCWVGPAVGSPHRPLIADLEWDR